VLPLVFFAVNCEYVFTAASVLESPTVES